MPAGVPASPVDPDLNQIVRDAYYRPELAPTVVLRGLREALESIREACGDKLGDPQ